VAAAADPKCFLMPTMLISGGGMSNMTPASYFSHSSFTLQITIIQVSCSSWMNDRSENASERISRDNDKKSWPGTKPLRKGCVPFDPRKRLSSPKWLIVTCYLCFMDFSRLSLYCSYPMAFQWASRRFLKLLTEVASTTCSCWGRLFQELMTLWLKKFFLRSRRDLLKDSLRLCLRRPCELSERWKNWCGSMFSFPVNIL